MSHGLHEAELALGGSGHEPDPTAVDLPRKPGPSHLTAKQEKACLARAAGGSIADSYRGAGYSTSGAHWHRDAERLFNLPEVRLRVDELVGRMREAEVLDVGISRGLIRTKVLANAETATVPKPVQCPKCEHKFTYWIPDWRARNQALELLGLDIGMFARRADIRFGKLDPLDGGNPEAFNERILALIQKLGISAWILERLSVSVGGSGESRQAAPRHLPSTS